MSANPVVHAVRANGKSVRLCRELLRLVDNRRASDILRDLVRYLETGTEAPSLAGASAGRGERSSLVN